MVSNSTSSRSSDEETLLGVYRSPQCDCSPKLMATFMCSCTLLPTPGRSTLVGMPILRRMLGFPMPESSSS